MRDALRIFRKDVRRLWPRVLFVIAIELLAGWAESAPTAAMARMGFLPRFIRWIAQWYLIISAIHEESLVGDRQYWVTRPISWKSLLLSKALFCFAFINLPVLAADVATLTFRSLSPLGFLPALLVVQFFVLALVVIPPAALASTTDGLVRAVWVFLACVCGFYLFVLVLSSHELTAPSWGSLEWLHGIVDSGFALVVVAAIVVFQYARRATGYSRVALAAGLVAFPLTFWTPGWRTAFDVQSRLTSGRAQDSVARLAFDPSRDPHPQPKGSLRRGGQIAWSVTIPVRISGVPAGMALVSERATASGITSSGRQWRSRLDSQNHVFQEVDSHEVSRLAAVVLPGDGEYWLYLNLDPSFTVAGADSIASLRATVAFDLLSEEETAPIERNGRPARLPDGGICWAEGKQMITVDCSWPVQPPDVAVLRYRISAEVSGSEYPLNADSGGTGPFSYSLDLWQAANVGIPISGVTEMSLATRRAVARFERTVEFQEAKDGMLP